MLYLNIHQCPNFNRMPISHAGIFVTEKSESINFYYADCMALVKRSYWFTGAVYSGRVCTVYIYLFISAKTNSNTFEERYHLVSALLRWIPKNSLVIGHTFVTWLLCWQPIRNNVGKFMLVFRNFTRIYVTTTPGVLLHWRVSTRYR